MGRITDVDRNDPNTGAGDPIDPKLSDVIQKAPSRNLYIQPLSAFGQPGLSMFDIVGKNNYGGSDKNSIVTNWYARIHEHFQSKILFRRARAIPILR